MSTPETRVKRDVLTPGRCPQCGQPRWLSRGRLWWWTLLRCSPCNVSWRYGRLSLSRWNRDSHGRPSR